MKHFYRDITGFFNFTRIYRDQVNRAENGYHFVEIGCWHGKSTAFMAVEIINSGKHIRFDVVDTFDGGSDKVLMKDTVLQKHVTVYHSFMENMKPVLHVINPIKGESVEVSKRYPDRSLDFVFIDADHRYESVKQDILHWKPKVKPGGTLAGHDYIKGYPGLVKAVDELLPGAEKVTTSWVVEL